MSTQPRCHWVPEVGWLAPEHLRDCKATDCVGCRPCGEHHCAFRRDCSTHVEADAGIITCPRCIGRVRSDLGLIEDLYAVAGIAVESRVGEAGLLLEEVEDGVDSEAFNLVGPAAAPEQYAEQRRRLGVTYDQRGWCDWPRHERFAEDDPHHPYAVLGRWDLALRETYGPQTDLFITVSSAADYLRNLLKEQFPHTQEFEDFAAAVARCRAHLEGVVHDSRVPEQGRHCPSCIEAHGDGPRLRKRYAVHPGLPSGVKCAIMDEAFDTGSRRCAICEGRNDTWHCPDNPEHWWSEEDYRLRVSVDYRQHAQALPASDLAERIGAPLSTVRKWTARRWDEKAKVWIPPRLVSVRRGPDGRKVYPVDVAVRLAESRSACFPGSSGGNSAAEDSARNEAGSSLHVGGR